MEESSEKRRERLRALREEASLANNGEERGGSCLALSSDPTGLPLPGDLQQVPAPASPSPRFEFYTDPLAAFSGSQKKKLKNSLGSPLSGGPAPPPCKSPPSPFWQPDFSPNFRPLGNANSPGLPNSYPNRHSPGRFSTPGPPNPNPYQYSTGNFPSPNSKSFSPKQPSVSGKFTSSGSFSTPGSTDFNPNMTAQGGYNFPGSSSVDPLSAFGSPQPFSASQMYNGTGHGSLNTPASNQQNLEHGGFSTDSSPQHRLGGVNSGQNNGWTQNGMHSGWSQGSNRSRGRFSQSPGSSGRGNRTPGWSGGRGFQRASHDVSAITNPELFAKRSMLVDPWKDLMPVRFESVASRLNACSVTGSRDWLPKSASKGMASPSTKGITIAASGPSLAESLAASYVDAVLGEDGV